MALPLFGPYRLIARLGRGGMCDVLLAAKDTERVDFTKLVVIKKLREEFTSNREFVTMFLDEARLAARFNHPNVVQTLEAGEQANDYYLVMEYLDGQPLNRIAAKDPPLSRSIRLCILSDVLSGIHYAHELCDYDGSPLRIVHRDLTPHNVFVTYDGQVKVVDFGIAKASGRTAETATGVLKGKIPYMSPEQVATDGEIDRRADVFCAGIMLFEATTGRRFWGDLKSADLLRALVTGKFNASPQGLVPEVHPQLDLICRKALEFDPEDRYPTAAALQEELDAYISAHEHRTSQREIGSILIQMFSEQRARARALVQEQLRDVLSSKRIVPVMPGSDRDALDISNSKIDVRSISSLHSTRPPPPGLDRTAGAQTVSGPLTVASAPSSSTRLVVLALAAVVCLVAAVVAARNLRTSGSTFNAAAGDPSSVTLTLRATPLETTFQVDDGPALENPYIGSAVRDEKVHTVSAKARGYVTKTEEVKLDASRSIRFALVPAEPEPR